MLCAAVLPGDRRPRGSHRRDRRPSRVAPPRRRLLRRIHAPMVSKKHEQLTEFNNGQFSTALWGIQRAFCTDAVQRHHIVTAIELD